MKHVLLLHGWATPASSFDDLVKRLSDDHFCHAIDLPGHGTAAVRAPTLSECSDAAAEALDKSGAAGILVVGWSMGAMVAWDLIGKRGTAGLSGLVTIDMSPKLANAPDWAHGLLGQSHEGPISGTALTLEWNVTAEVIVKSTMFATENGAQGYPFEKALTDVKACDPDLMAQLWDDMLAADYRDVVRQIDIPWLIVRGGRSTLFSAGTSDWLLREAPSAELIVFESDGHAPHLESPDRFEAALRDFESRL